MKTILRVGFYVSLFVFFLFVIKEFFFMYIFHDPMFKNEAAWALRMADEYITHSTQRRINRLDRDLNDKDPAVRVKAVVLLGELEYPKKAEILTELAKDPEFEVRLESVRALGKAPDQLAMNTLLKKLEDGNKMIRESALDSIGELAKRGVMDAVAVRKLLEHGAEMEVEKALAEVDDEVLIQIIAVRLKNGDDIERANAARTFLRMSSLWQSKLVPLQPVIAALKDRNVNVRRSAIKILDNMTDNGLKSPEVIKALISGVRDYDPEVVLNSLYALEYAAVTPDIIDAAVSVSKHQDPRIRKLSMIMLGNSGASQAANLLIEAMNDREFYVRKTAASAFKKIKDPRAVDPLIKLARKDPYWDVSDAAAEALKNQGDARGMEVVRRHYEAKAAWEKKR